MHCMTRRAVVAATILVALHTPAAAGWKMTNLGKTATYCSIALDADGHPHIAYLEPWKPTDYRLRYATFNGKSWRREVVDSGDVGMHSDIAVDSQGHPHIVYADRGSVSNLHYAAFDGQNWTINTLDSGGFGADIVIDANDHPHVSYAQSNIGGNSPLRYAHHDGSNWIFETVANNILPFSGSSIALTSTGKAYISYNDQSATLYVANNTAGTWFVGSMDTGYYSSLAIDSVGQLHIYYVGAAATKYAVWGGTMWSFTSLPAGFSTSLALDSNNRPHVAAGLTVNNQSSLTYGTNPGSGFVGVSLGVPNIGNETGIAVDGFDLPHIVAAKRTNSDTLVYARLQLPDLRGAFQNVSRTPLVGSERVEATLAVSNHGNLNARAQSVQFFVSTDAVLDAGDTPVGQPRNVGGVAAGKSRMVNFSQVFPGTVPGGFLFAVLDSTEKNVEISEFNNTVLAFIP